MRKYWFSFVGCLALAAGHTGLYAQDDETVAPAAEPTLVAPEEPAARLQPIPEIVDSSAIGFLRVTNTGGFANAQRTTVRIVRNGRIVQARRLGEGGVAQISEVAPGAYTVLANGSEGFAAYGIYLGDIARIVTPRVGLVPQRDSILVRSLIRTHLQSGTTGGTAAAPKDAVSSDSSSTNSDFELQADGTMKGQFIRATTHSQDNQPIADMYIAFIRDGQVVAESRSDANGEFTITGLAAGIYSLAIAGREGFATFSAGVVQPETHVQARTRRFEFVALQQGSSAFTVVPASPSDAALFSAAGGGGGGGAGGGAAAAGSGAGGAGAAGSGAGGSGAGGSGAGGSGAGGSGLLSAGIGAGIGAVAAFILATPAFP